ncbi:flagellar biosynthesis anti-sigma factor FlgM [Clostridiales bacterium COT073_COT-073]|nr:flagellar biosynthesis anti-sigma factor FlgM [Clostridiales bacterium COT073_COT-073]
MRIVRTEKLQSVYGNQPVKRAEAKAGVSYGQDSVVFSTFAREMQFANKAVKEAPEVRVEKVNMLKAQIEAGKYNISANQIAEKILGF